MKRILIPGTFVFTLILLFAFLARHTSQPVLADEKQSANPAKWEHLTFKSEVGRDEDVSVLRLWDSAASDSRWPQLALLRLSPTAYKELSKDSKTFKVFIDGTQTGKPIFDAPVTITENCKLPAAAEKYAEGVGWLVTVDHRQSRCGCTALQEQEIANP
jgi:hypothetical protein